VVVGWGPAGQRIGELLQVLGLRLTVVRHRDEPAGVGVRTLTGCERACRMRSGSCWSAR
jgi:hypothetical protein